jgi:hypothetical protein
LDFDSFCIIPYIKDDGNYPNKLNTTCDMELPNIFKYSGQSFIIIPIIGTIRAAPLISNNAKNIIYIVKSLINTNEIQVILEKIDIKAHIFTAYLFVYPPYLSIIILTNTTPVSGAKNDIIENQNTISDYLTLKTLSK